MEKDVSVLLQMSEPQQLSSVWLESDSDEQLDVEPPSKKACLEPSESVASCKGCDPVESGPPTLPGTPGELEHASWQEAVAAFANKQCSNKKQRVELQLHSGCSGTGAAAWAVKVCELCSTVQVASDGLLRGLLRPRGLLAGSCSYDSNLSFLSTDVKCSSIS